MGMLDSLLGSVLGGGDKQNALVQIATNLIANNSSGNGLAGLAQQFEQQGLGHLMQSWIGTGANQPITPDQVHQVLGAEQVRQFAQQHGLQGSQVTTALAALLPQIIDKLTPHGQVPATGDLQGMTIKFTTDPEFVPGSVCNPDNFKAGVHGVILSPAS